MADTIREFPARGPDAARTGAISKAAGISQPYRFKTCGTKSDHVLAALDRVFAALFGIFAAGPVGKPACVETLSDIGIAGPWRRAADDSHPDSRDAGQFPCP